MARAVGVGGVFLKASDPKKLSAWYAEHLGIPSQDGGSLAFDGPESLGMTVFAHFPESTKYFGEGQQQMFKRRVLVLSLVRVGDGAVQGLFQIARE